MKHKIITLILLLFSVRIHAQLEIGKMYSETGLWGNVMHVYADNLNLGTYTKDVYDNEFCTSSHDFNLYGRFFYVPNYDGAYYQITDNVLWKAQGYNGIYKFNSYADNNTGGIENTEYPGIKVSDYTEVFVATGPIHQI